MLNTSGDTANDDSATEAGQCPAEGGADKAHTPDRQALNDIIKDVTGRGRQPLSGSDADTILDWANELGIKGVRDDRETDHWVGGGHIHIPGSPIRHIPAK
jgi:hypothetical protein